MYISLCATEKQNITARWKFVKFPQMQGMRSSTSTRSHQSSLLFVEPHYLLCCNMKKKNKGGGVKKCYCRRNNNLSKLITKKLMLRPSLIKFSNEYEHRLWLRSYHVLLTVILSIARTDTEITFVFILTVLKGYVLNFLSGMNTYMNVYVRMHP